MAATDTRSGDFAAPRARRKKPIAAILALLCDLAGWLLFPSFWDEDPWAAIGALMLSVLFAGIGGVVALLGLFVSSWRTSHRRPRPRNALGLGLIALAASLASIAIFIATFYWIEVSSG